MTRSGSARRRRAGSACSESRVQRFLLRDPEQRHAACSFDHGRRVSRHRSRWVAHYNERRLHAALHYLPPAEYYAGDPAARQAERRQKLAGARLRRREQNRQRLQNLPRRDDWRSVTRRAGQLVQNALRRYHALYCRVRMTVTLTPPPAFPDAARVFP